MQTLKVYHGTDKEYAEKIISGGFEVKTSKTHWLGNGIYFFTDYSLAKWWTTNPTSKYGKKINVPAIIEAELKFDESDIFDLRKLTNYLEFCRIYKDEFWSDFVGNIKEGKSFDKPIDLEELRCSFCDYLYEMYSMKGIVGTFNLSSQQYLPAEYGKYFDKFNINYTQVQVCLYEKEQDIIKSMNIIV